tara:strand:- start:148 stop:366 length:219 start_codon:yes stop_codon:yes gene_type:complete
MNLKINGEERVINFKDSQPSLAMLIKEMGHHPQLIVVEFNGEILDQKKWTSQELKSGDTLEIVTIVGGGSTY